MYRAVLFIPHEDPAHDRWVLVCGKYCNSHGYLITAIAGCWESAWAMLVDHAADIVVMARRDHLPPDHMPRTEFVEEEHTRPDPSPSQRRPHRHRT